MKEHDAEIEHFISTGHDRVKTAGLDYLKRLIGFVKAQLLGAVQEESAAAANRTGVRSSGGGNTVTSASASSPPRNSQQQGQTYAQSLLARFSQPSARSASAAIPPPPATSSAAAGGGVGFGGIDGAPALYGLLASALQAATAAKSPTSSSSTSREAPPIPTAPPSLNNPADRAQYAEGLRALLKAFEKQSPATDKEVGSHPVASGTTTPPPAGFEAIEHEDAAISEAEKEKPALGKRKSTGGGAWGGWMWGGGKGEVKVGEGGNGDYAGKSEIK